MVLIWGPHKDIHRMQWFHEVKYQVLTYSPRLQPIKECPSLFSICVLHLFFPPHQEDHYCNWCDVMCDGVMIAAVVWNRVRENGCVSFSQVNWTSPHFSMVWTYFGRKWDTFLSYSPPAKTGSESKHLPVQYFYSGKWKRSIFTWITSY